SKFKVFLSDPSALIGFNKYLYINLRPEAETLEEKGTFSQLFADKRQTLNTTSGFDYFIFSRTFTQKIINGADYRSLDITQTGTNSIAMIYSLTLRKQPEVGSFYHINVDIPKVRNIYNDGDRIRFGDDCTLTLFKETDQNYKINSDNLLLDVSKPGNKIMEISLNVQLDCN